MVIYRINSTKELQSIFLLKKRKFIYGTGKTTTIVLEKLKRIGVKKKDISFFSSYVSNDTISNNYSISDNAELSMVNPTESVVLISTIEAYQDDIFKTIKKYYSGDLYVLSDEWIMANSANLRIKEGMLPCFYADIPNMGDKLNELIIERKTGLTVKSETKEACRLVGIGSGLGNFFVDISEKRREYDDVCSVWGTGFLNNYDIKDKVPLREKMDFRLIRGEYSKKCLEILYGKIECPIGDPGLLTSYYMNEKVEKKYSIGIVPHYREQNLSIISDLYNYYKNSCIINLRLEPILVIRQIMECEVILSSSLHGAIVADSFGIPNMLIKMSSVPYGDGFKYKDYYSAYGIEDFERFNVIESGAPEVFSIKEKYCIDDKLVKQICENILGAFPII